MASNPRNTKEWYNAEEPGRSKESQRTPEVGSMKPVKPGDQPAAQQQPTQKTGSRVVLCKSKVELQNNTENCGDSQK